MKKDYFTTYVSPKDQHNRRRTLVKWTDAQRNTRTVDQLSDSHLLHVIGYLQGVDNPDQMKETLEFMLNEARFRYEENIFVPEYEEKELTAKEIGIKLLNGENIDIDDVVKFLSIYAQ